MRLSNGTKDFFRKKSMLKNSQLSLVRFIARKRLFFLRRECWRWCFCFVVHFSPFILLCVLNAVFCVAFHVRMEGQQIYVNYSWVLSCFLLLLLSAFRPKTIWISICCWPLLLNLLVAVCVRLTIHLLKRNFFSQIQTHLSISLSAWAYKTQFKIPSFYWRFVFFFYCCHQHIIRETAIEYVYVYVTIENVCTANAPLILIVILCFFVN